MARFFDCDYNISNLVIILSIHVLVNVTRGVNDGPIVSSYAWLIVRLGEGLGKVLKAFHLVVPSVKFCDLFNSFGVACPSVDFSCAKT
jgi:hypothetical protein